MKNNIILISDNLELSKSLSQRLVLLRNSDELKVCSFEDALIELEKFDSYIIFLHHAATDAETEEQIKIIRLKSPESQIILVANRYNPDFIMAMYDSGIYDYILSDADISEVLIKSINLMKYMSLKKSSEMNIKLLKTKNELSEYGFYTESSANEIISDALLENDFNQSVFIIVTYDELDRAKFSFDELANAIKTSVRDSDLVIELASGKFYILLSNSDRCGALKVFEKIQKALSGDFRIKAGISSVNGKDFKEIEQKTSSALTDAMLSANDYVFYEENEFLPDEDWVLEPTSTQKDFKLFRNIFNKKLNKIITPVFFQMKEAYEGKLEGTIIEEFTNENQCIFNLKSRKQISRLTIVYPGLGKVVIYVTHSGLESPENKEIILSVKELTQPVLTDIMEIFINDYKTCIERQEI